MKLQLLYHSVSLADGSVQQMVHELPMSHDNQLGQFMITFVILRRRKEPKFRGNMATSRKNRYVKLKSERYSKSGIKIIAIHFSGPSCSKGD